VGAPDFVEAIRRESDAFASAAERGDLTARVPSCPDWTLGDLVWHLTDVQWFWTQIAGGPLLSHDDVGPRPEPPPNDDHLVAGFREGAAELVDILEATGPAVRLWSWAGGEQDIAWVRRRQAHEAAIHRWDAEATVGDPAPIEAALALDGIDEWVEWMVDPEELTSTGPVSVRFVAIDIDAERQLQVQDDGTFAREPDGGPDGTVTASASDLDLLLWRRVAPADVSILGDRSAVERFLGATDLT
jgi:uncharacterized protein (TIGR03083 family)